MSINKDLLTIFLPKNPYWKVFKRFGRDEFFSMIFNVAGTIFIAFIIKNIELTEAMKIFLISIAGPVIEKIGLYAPHFYFGFTDVIRGRGNFFNCLWQRFKDGSISLLEDILVHDPIYITLMYLGLKLMPGLNEGILSFNSFIIAVVIVSLIEVFVIELKYKRFKHSLKGTFHRELYYESRFVIENHNPIDIVDKLISKFDLKCGLQYSFEDTYYKSLLPIYNGRTGKIRHRKFEISDNDKIPKRFEIIYTISAEIPQNTLTQYRYFINKKEKFFTLGLTDSKDNKFNKYGDLNIFKKIKFFRVSAKDPNGLYVAVDIVLDTNGKHHYNVIELKVFEDIELLKTAMKFIMDEFKVVQTTSSKIDMC